MPLDPVTAALDVGGKLIDKIFPDKGEARKHKARLLELQQQGELTELEERMSTIRAEATSGDAWTSRARPSFMYVIYLVVIVNCIAAPFASIFAPEATGVYFQNISAGFGAIPGEVWATFTAGYLGYTGARTYEKQKGVAK